MMAWSNTLPTADGKTVSQSGDGASNQANAGPTMASNDNSPADLLPRQKCLDALAALRHAKWFQVCSNYHVYPARDFGFFIVFDLYIYIFIFMLNTSI